MVNIDVAQAADLPELLQLLERNGLPREGLADHLATTVVARAENRVVGSAALEVYGGAALLRSLAVDESLRGRGLGQELTQAALNLARSLGVAEVYLLTETAQGFFPRFGFRVTSREQVPEAVRRSVEFVSACPASAQAMVAEV